MKKYVIQTLDAEANWVTIDIAGTITFDSYVIAELVIVGMIARTGHKDYRIAAHR
jgi:hypothetical protein